MPARVFVIGTLALMSVVCAAATANAQVIVGGHVGFVIPWVTHAGGHNNNHRGPISDWLPNRCELQGARPHGVGLRNGSVDRKQPTNR